jgi:hypothetical protein
LLFLGIEPLICGPRAICGPSLSIKHQTQGEHLSTTLRLLLTALSLCATAAFSTQSAYAWGCIAVSENGTYGYSYNYGNEDDATARALDECAKRATTDQTCEIQECDEDL